MKDYRAILRNVGWVLIVGGLVDIGFMIYCVANQTSYSSSFNIFAVIAGIFLLRGNLKAARIISFFMAFFIAAFIGILIVIPFLFPLDLMIAYTRLETVNVVAGIVLFPVIMILFAWIYRKLTSLSVCAAMEEAKINYTSFWRRPGRGFWIGGCLALSIVVFLSLLMGGVTADEAKQRASTEVGEGYKFHVKTLNMSSGTNGKHVHAVVTAYNDTEIKDIVVKWSE